MRMRPGRVFIHVVAVVAATLVAGPTASAQPDYSIKPLPPEPTEKDKNPPPSFEVVVIGAAKGIAAKDFVLKGPSYKDPENAISVKADKVKKYTESTDKMMLVVLIQGNGDWMGNETYFQEGGEDGEAPKEGAFTGLGGALDVLGQAGPPGSLATLLLYGGGDAQVKYEVGDATKLNASALGTQENYKDYIDFPLLVGLKKAIAVFDNNPGFRKILVVIGDGTGEQQDITGELNKRIQELQERKVEVFSIFYVAGQADGETVVGQGNMKSLGYTESQVATSRENFATYAQGFVDKIGQRYYLAFPGATETKPPQAFAHDGQRYEFMLSIQGEELEPREVQTIPWDAPKPPEETSLWWLWTLLIVLPLIILVVVLVKRAQNRPPAQPQMMEMPPPEMEMAPPPPSGPAKTMMLGIGGQDDGFPIVGWIVPLNGPNQYQTFKLLQGVTKIGSGPTANIIIQDSFMSTEHCEIVMSPTGFVLKDGGSTNGTYVNEGRASTHELVDNDTMTMGKTNFKFKSIN